MTTFPSSHAPATRGLSLYELEDRLHAAHEELSAALERGEDTPPGALAVIEEYALAAGEKRDACAAVIRAREMEEAYIDQEIARLMAVKAKRRAARDRLLAYMLETMRAHGMGVGDWLKGVTTKISIRQNPEHVEVGDPGRLPEEFVRTVTRQEPDKVAIKAALKSGREVGEARLVPGELRLEIR